MRRSLVMLLLATSLVAIPLSSAGAAPVTFTSTQTFTPPTSAFPGSAGGGDGWNVGVTATKVYNIYHHNSGLAIMCHNQSDGSDCWTTTDTGTAHTYKVITAQVGGSTATFNTPGNSDLYIDNATGYLYTFVTRVDGSYSQPGVVCINTNLANSVTNPVCSGAGGQPNAWTPLGGTADSEINSSNPNPFGGTNPLVVDKNRIYAYNNYGGAVLSPGGDNSSAKNALLCYDIALMQTCSGSPFSLQLGASADFQAFSFNDGTSPGLLLSGNYYLPLQNSSGNLILDCLTLSSTPTECSGSWPIITSNSYLGIPSIPDLTSGGDVLGICTYTYTQSNSFEWLCFNSSGVPLVAPSGLTVFTGTLFSSGPVVVGTRVLLPGQSGVECYDFSTNASCSAPQAATSPSASAHSYATGGSFPMFFDNRLVYSVAQDPYRPSCIWVNADGGNYQIQSFDAITGGNCGATSVTFSASAVIAPFQACLPTTFTSISITSSTSAFVTSPGPTLKFKNSSGEPIDGPYTFTGSTPTINLASLNYTTPLDLSTRSALPQFEITMTPTGLSLGTVTVQVSWTGNDYGQCSPGYVGPVPSTGSATSVADASAILNGSLNNPGDTMSTPSFCYSTSNFTAGSCSGITVSATSGSVTGTNTPYSKALTGLLPGTTYYFEYLVNDVTTSKQLYGDVSSFTTGPILTSLAASAINTTSATLNGSIYNPGSDSITAKFCYQLTSFTSGHCSGTTTNAATGGTNGGITTYSLGLTGLSVNSTYFFEFLGASPSNLFGGVLSFITGPNALTTAATSIGRTSATLNGKIFNPSNATFSSVQFCFSSVKFTSGHCTGTPQDGVQGVVSNATALYSYGASTLVTGVAYYFEIVGTYSGGTVLGGVQNFIAGAFATTQSATPYGEVINGLLTNQSSDTMGTAQFCYQFTSFASGRCSGTTVNAVSGVTSGQSTPYYFVISATPATSVVYFEFSINDTTTSTVLRGGVVQYSPSLFYSKPDAPKNVVAVMNNGSAQVSFTPGSTGNLPTYYVIDMFINSQPVGNVCSISIGNVCPISNLGPDTSFTFTAKAINSLGSNVSSLSNAVSYSSPNFVVPTTSTTTSPTTTVPQTTAVTPSVSSTVYFETDSALLTPESKSILNSLVQQVVSNKIKVLHINGYTDLRASAAYNIALAQHRNTSVANYITAELLKLNVKGVSFVEVAIGITTESTNLALNRKVEVTS